MISPNGLYIAGAIFATVLIAARFLSTRKSSGLFYAVAALTSLEAGLLTDYGLPLPSRLWFMVTGLWHQMVAGGAMLLVNLVLAWVVFWLLSRHSHTPRHA